MATTRAARRPTCAVVSRVSGSEGVRLAYHGLGAYFTPYLNAAPGSWASHTWAGSLVEHGAGAAGLLYRRNRYYDPQSGRFTQQDPIGLGGGLNVYGFAGGDPVNYSDPFGLCTFNKVICKLWTGFLNWREENDRRFEATCEGGADGNCVPVALGVPAWIGGPAGVGAELSAVERQFGNITAELKASDHFAAARLERTGRLSTGFDHAEGT